MNYGAAKVYAMQHIKNYSNRGTPILITDTNYQDYILSMPPAANTAQMELCKISKIPGQTKISQNPIDNLLGLLGFDEKQHFPGTDDTYIGPGAKSFSIEVDKPCTIYFDEYISGIWTPLSGTYSLSSGTPSAFIGSITVTGNTSFTNYRGLLTIASASNDIRMKIVTLYPMKSRYRALFAYPFATAVEVPWYRAYIPYDLASNYMEFHKMYREYDQRQFQEHSDYILKNDKKIYLNWFLTGEFIVDYWIYPTEITNSVLDTYEFEVGVDAQSCIPWYMGAYAVMADANGKALGIQLLNQYYTLRDSIKINTNTSPSEIIDTTGGW